MPDIDDVEVVIGGTALVLPPLTFYVLKRAWPMIQQLAEMDEARRAAGTAPSDTFVAQTDVALHIIASVLAANSPEADPLTQEDLSRRLLLNEIPGVHQAISSLMAHSGLTPGELTATGSLPAPKRSNGIDSSPSSSLTE